MKRFRNLSRNYGSSSRQDFWFFANCENIVAIWFCTEPLIFVQHMFYNLGINIRNLYGRENCVSHLTRLNAIFYSEPSPKNDDKIENMSMKCL